MNLPASITMNLPASITMNLPASALDIYVRLVATCYKS